MHLVLTQQTDYKLPHSSFLSYFSQGVEWLIDHRQGRPPPPMPVTRLGGIFGIQMAEYTVSQIINYERRAFALHDQQKSSSW